MRKRAIQFIKLAVFGDHGVGKSRLLSQQCMCRSAWIPFTSDECSYRKLANIDDEMSVLDIQDFSVLEEFTALRNQWIRDADGFLIVYSISSRSTFERAERFRDEIFRVKNVDTVPLMLIGNMCDKVTEREVSREEGYVMARRLGCEFLETSANTCVDIERSFYILTRIIQAERDKKYALEHSKAKKERRCNIL